jgi:hypothetical protein
MIRETKNNYKLYVLNKETLFYHEYSLHVETGIIYKSCNNDILKALRRFHLKFHLPFYYFWYTKEFREESKSNNTIIIFDSLLTRKAANYLAARRKTGRVIYWFWNHIYNPEILAEIANNVEKWSYDERDCGLYELKFNHQFYFKSLCNYLDYDKEQDFFFVGTDKGRADIIDETSKMIDDYHLKKKFVVMKNTRSSRIALWMPYDTIVYNIRHSRCVVDIVPPQQRGLTLRPLEALFHHRKLLTNNPNINLYPFYNSNNVFRLGIDKDLIGFLEKPFDDTVLSLIDSYDFNDWLDNFDKN